MNNSEKLRLKQFFKDMNLNYIPSATNFITLEFKTEEKEYLKRYGFISDHEEDG